MNQNAANTPIKNRFDGLFLFLFLALFRSGQKYEDSALHSIYFANDFKRNVDDLFEAGKLPEDPSFYLYRPTLKDASLAPDGQEGLYVLVPVPELSKFDQWTDETIQSYRQQIIGLLKEKRSLRILMNTSCMKNVYARYVQ